MNLQQLLLMLLAGGNQNQLGTDNQNPLMQLLAGGLQQDPAQQLMAALSGATGMQSNALNPQLLAAVLGMQQKTTQPKDINAQLASLLGAQQPQQSGGLDAAKLLELLQGAAGPKKEKSIEEQLAELLSGKKSENEDDDILTRLQKQSQKQSEAKDTEADLTEAIKFNLEFDKFIEDNSEMFPDWFDINDVKEDVEKWAKTPAERAQGLAAATVRAFFKDEKMLDLLEERDRTTVKDKIIKDGIKSHEIDRKLAWPLIERSMFNKNKLSDAGHEVPSTKEGQAMEDYGSIFEQGQQSNGAGAEVKVA